MQLVEPKQGCVFNLAYDFDSMGAFFQLMLCLTI